MELDLGKASIAQIKLSDEITYLQHQVNKCPSGLQKRLQALLDKRLTAQKALNTTMSAMVVAVSVEAEEVLQPYI